MAADGPVTPGNEEITVQELREIYELAIGETPRGEYIGLKRDV